MAYDLSLFDKLDVLSKPIYITLPDGSVKHVTLAGSVRLGSNFFLQQVLYVPEFKFNLLSVTKLLADQKLCIHIYPTKCVFQALTTNQVVATAHEHNGLYLLRPFNRSTSVKDCNSQQSHKDEKTVISECFTAANETCNQLPLEVLHAILGHTSMSEMKHITDFKVVLSNSFSCEVCILAKAHRLPFGRSTISTKKPFELLHLDLWGPYRVASLNGARYFVTIVDDFTRNTWTQLLQYKT